MIICNNCGATNQEDVKICLTCGQSLKNESVLVKNHFGYDLDFNQPENLPGQIRDYFFKIMRFRIETELDPKGYRKYFDHFHSSGFYKKFDLKAARLTEEAVEIYSQNEPLRLEKIDRLLGKTFESLLDYFIVAYCEPLHKMKLPDAILRYENVSSETLDLGQIILDFLDLEHEHDKCYTDFLKLPANKLNNAKEAFLFSEKEEDLFLICDQTVFGSCKEGFALTDKALYWKAHFNEPGKVFYNEIAEIRREAEWITINGQFFNVNKTMNYKMILLLKKLKTCFDQTA